MATHSIFWLNERVIDGYDVHAAVLDSVIAQFMLATVWRMRLLIDKDGAVG